MLKKKRTILIIAGIIVLIASIAIISTSKGESDVQQNDQSELTEMEEYTDADTNEDVEDVFNDNSTKPTATGVDIVGLWIDKEEFETSEDLDKGPYTAYDFTEYQYVIRLKIKDNGEAETTHGTWEIKENSKDTVDIQWKDIEGNTTSEESFKYNVNDKQLTMNDVVYTQLPEKDEYISMFY